MNTLPKVTSTEIEAFIEHEFYFTAHEGISGAELERHLLEAEEPFTVTVNPSMNHKYPPKGPLTQLTFCVLILKNGHVVTGQSFFPEPMNRNAKALAKAHAISKCRELMEYANTDCNYRSEVKKDDGTE